MCNVYIIKPPQ
jgi:hypothetical protein